MRNADALSGLDRDLQTIFAGRLKSLVVYGGASVTEGPVTTLALVESLTPADLRACAARVTTWQKFGLATPLLIGADEFARSLDAFPFEFGAILADHDVVSGPDPFADLRVEPEDLRRACEVQARSHLLHLRESYMETLGRGDLVASLVMRSAPALAALLRNVGRLTGAPAATGVLTRVAELGPSGTGEVYAWGFPFGHERSASGWISSDEAERLFPSYLTALEELVAGLDRWSRA